MSCLLCWCSALGKTDIGQLRTCMHVGGCQKQHHRVALKPPPATCLMASWMASWQDTINNTTQKHARCRAHASKV